MMKLNLMQCQYQLNDTEIGVQILNTPVFDKYMSKLNRPDSGPLLSSVSNHKTRDTSDPEPANEEPANEEPAAMEQFDEIDPEPNLDEITMENNQEEAPIMTQE